MFKLESYITPLLLSYVDKYIKNLKPEDSQVSLWGGDAVFNNLDLRLDVLEQELCMPFTFINGHIHELRIHVPWTKLGSEPVLITINTIECVLKLCAGSQSLESSTEGSESIKTPLKVRGEPKVVSGSKGSSPDGSEQSATSSESKSDQYISQSYVQSLVNRVLNNISIVCNNVILKYVEDDIVLSLNVKSLEAVSANGDWDEAFADLSLPELVLRKLVRLQDLTVCLDRRNASGKITLYQDPLLYRCSLECRLLLVFESLRAKRLVSCRFDILCSNLDFSVTDHQLPMFLRLVELCLALYFNEIASPRPTVTNPRSNTIESDVGSTGEVIEDEVSTVDSSRSAEEPEDGQGWGSWMWSYVPSGFSGWIEDEDEASDLSSGRSFHPSPVMRFGLYIKRASFVVKVAESVSGNGTFSMQKVTFRPLCSFQTDGVFLDILFRGLDVFNVVMGIHRVCGIVSGHCACGIADCEDATSEANRFFLAGTQEPSVDPDCDSYLKDSLFDIDSRENCKQRQEYVFDWDKHFAAPLEDVVRTRASALFFDYFYLMEVPEDVSDRSSGLSVADFEYSNLKERGFVRAIVGRSKLDVTSSVVHRAQLILHATKQYDYEPYLKSKNADSRTALRSHFQESADDGLSPPTADEVSLLERFIPSRTLSVVVGEPVIRIFMANHPFVSIPITKPKQSHSSRVFERPIPILVIKASNVTLTRSCAMYPRRVVKAACMLGAPSDNLLYYSHCHICVKLNSCGVCLVAEDSHDKIPNILIHPCDVLVRYKRLFFPSYWKNFLLPHAEIVYKVNQIGVRATNAQLVFLKFFYASWFSATFPFRHITETSLVSDLLCVDSRRSSLECVVTNFEWKTCDTMDVVAYATSLGSFVVQLHVKSLGGDGGLSIVPILSSPEKRDEVNIVEFFGGEETELKNDRVSVDRSVCFTLQLPKRATSGSVPCVFFLNVNGIVVCLDLRFSEFVCYRPQPIAVSVLSEKRTRPLTDDHAQKESFSRGSVFSSSLTTLPTNPSVPIDASSEPTQTNPLSKLIVDWYPLLHNLSIQVEISETSLFMSKDLIPWIVADGDVLSNIRRLFANNSLPDTLILNLPSLFVTNRATKEKLGSIFGFQDIPIAHLDGWSPSSDRFPWNVKIRNYSIHTLQRGRVLEHCLSPGSLSATVAVTSKTNPNHPSITNISQLSLCVHCDIQQILLRVSKSQAKLVSELILDYLTVFSNVSLFHDVGLESRGSQFAGLTIPPETALFRSQTLVRKQNSNSCQTETVAGTVLAAVISEQDDVQTTGTSATKRSSTGKDVVKVSLWVQTTLPKFSVDVVACDDGHEVRFSFELEDISSSIDVQEVYSKIKLKVSSMNSTNYRRASSSDEWLLGPFDGITFSHDERITRTVHVANPKPGIDPVCLHSHDRGEDSQSHGSFLLATFTRAQCRNVQKRWAKVLRDCSSSDLGNRLQHMCETSSNTSHVRCISEIDVKVMPLDCVIWAPLFSSVAEVFQPFVAFVLQSLASSSPSNDWPLSSSVDEETTASLPLFSTARLPLIYASFSTIRVFFPKLEADKKKKLEKPDDLVVLQIDSIYLTPNVDNPLSRLVLKQDVFDIAQRAGILMIPGSEIEDRQYQLDISGLSLATGSWDKLMSCTKKSSPLGDVTKLKTMGENPALEWNTKLCLDDGRMDLEIVFSPLVSKFNLRAVAAPAIVYENGELAAGSGNESIVVAGHSLEINTTTDIDIYVGLNQLILLQDLVVANTIAIFGNKSDVTVSAEPDKADFKHELIFREIRDSGIESESSILHPLLMEARALNLPAMRPPDVPTVSQTVRTPFEVLLTARCITVTTYSPAHFLRAKGQAAKSEHQPVSLRVGSRKRSDLEWLEGQSTSTEGSPIRQVKPPPPPRRKRVSKSESRPVSEMEGYEGSEEESVDDDGTAEDGVSGNTALGSKLVPLFRLFVSQPYMLLKWREQTQRLELSCYDVNLRASPDMSPTRHDFPLPKEDDFSVVWFDSLPGDTSQKTGVPPALFTLAVTNFLDKLCIDLKVERPWKVSFSNPKYEQAVDFGRLMNSHFGGGGTKETSGVEPQDVYARRTLANLRSALSNIERMSYRTGQIVLAFETGLSSNDVQLVVAFGEVSGSVAFECGTSSEIVESANFVVDFDSFVVQTGADKKTRTLLGPSSLTCSFNALWEDWNGFAPFPQLLVKFGIDVLFVVVDQEHLRCLSVISSHAKRLVTDADPRSNDAPSKATLANIWCLKNGKVQHQMWQDDLRVGVFQYTQDADDLGLMPSANEIIFCKEHGGQPASMTWRYPQPRCLTRIEIHPVPFRAASEVAVDRDSQDEAFEVRCALQYWDVLHQCFVTYKVFQLSETQHCCLDVPQVSVEICKDSILAHTWRVVMDFTDDGYEDLVGTSCRGLVSPLALAACMRVDSCFDSRLVPFVEFLLVVDLLRLTLANYFPQRNSETHSTFLKPFVLDGTMPEYQDFLIVSLENASSRCQLWRSVAKLEVDAVLASELVDYKFLTMRHLLEPFGAKVRLFVTDRDDGSPMTVVDVSTEIGPAFVHLSQTAVHTLTSGLATFARPESDRSAHVMNRYVICNNTQETLRFGQVDTDESITLHKFRANAYSWRSHKTKQVLHACIEGMRWKWCDAFAIDTVGTEVRIVRCKSQKATIIIEVRELSATQVQVVISGQLFVSNRLVQSLEVRLRPSSKFFAGPALRDEGESFEKSLSTERLAHVEQTSYHPSFVVQHGDSWVLQVRLHRSETNSRDGGWSTDIYVDRPTASDNGHLLRVGSAEDPGRSVSFWCHVFSQPFGKAVKNLVVFTPLYVVRSHFPLPLNLELETPALGKTFSLEVDGMGHECQIFCPGEPDLTHQLSFRLMPGLELSKPPLPLSPNMIGHAAKLPQDPNGIDIESLCNDWMSTLPHRWPYDDEDLDRYVAAIPKNLLAVPKPVSKGKNGDDLLQPNIDLEVSLVQRWPGCNTLLVDVKPWAILVNRAAVELVFSVDEDWVVARDGTFALPKIEESFKLGISSANRVFYSKSIRLSAEDWSLNRYFPVVEGILPRNGHISCEIDVELPTSHKICRLTLVALEKEGIRVVTVYSRCVVVNETNSDLVFSSFSVLNIGQKLQLDPCAVSLVELSRDDSPTSVLFWDMFDVLAKDADSNDEYVDHVMFGFDDRSVLWSNPLRIEATDGTADRIHSFVVPLSSSDDGCSTMPLRMSVHCHYGRTFLVVKTDRDPQFKLHNNCNFALHYGQSTTVIANGAESVVHEERELFDVLPILKPHSSSFYTFPFVASKFPEIYDTRQNLPKLHLAKVVPRGSYQATIWSAGVGFVAAGEQFLSIPNCGDIKVHVEKVMSTVHVFLDPVNRVEVSAKEIRSRISSKGSPERSPTWRRKARLVSSKKKAATDVEAAESKAKQQLCSSAVDHVSEIDDDDRRIAKLRAKADCSLRKNALFYGNARFGHICIVLLDDISEILRVSVDDVHLMTRPIEDSLSASTGSRTSVRILPFQRQEVLVCVSDVQIDNQLYGRGGHDFPVVLIRQSKGSDIRGWDLSKARKDGLVVVSVVLERKAPQSGPWFVRDVDVTLKPIAIYAEDTLLYTLTRYFQSYFFQSSARVSRRHRTERKLVPDAVLLCACNLGSPVTLQHVVVHPTSVLLSLHASLKLFVSLNHTPLSFRAFERQALHTTWDRLGHAVAMHYLSGALIRAGWVIGSLDLLANPGGFARAVSLGMADFIRLPYRGLTRGPWAFVVGVAHGSSSLFRHVSSGTLLSITNLASSVSRNMDRLSLDREHSRRNEELRRSTPSGVTKGLAQGLTGLGISLLGAVAGIVDQPLQSIQEGEELRSTTSTAAGIISGVSRGLVGIVTKPIGGAAEFVAQTGQGILHGAGWVDVLSCRYDVVAEDPSAAINSPLKYVWKMLPDRRADCRVFAIEATNINAAGRYQASVLLLTPEVVFVVSTNADMQQQAFLLSELDCNGHGTDPTLIYFVPRETTDTSFSQLEDSNRDRIAEFIDKASRYALARSKTDESESASDSTSQTSTVGQSSSRFYVSPRLKNTFVAKYRMAQRKLLGKGYPV